MRESQIEKALVRRVKLLGGEIRKVAWISRHSCPDRFVMLLPPVAVRLGFSRNPWVETKRPKKDANEAQAREHIRMRRCGEIVLLINTLEQIDEWFPESAKLTDFETYAWLDLH